MLPPRLLGAACSASTAYVLGFCCPRKQWSVPGFACCGLQRNVNTLILPSQVHGECWVDTQHIKWGDRTPTIKIFPTSLQPCLCIPTGCCTSTLSPRFLALSGSPSVLLAQPRCHPHLNTGGVIRYTHSPPKLRAHSQINQGSRR